ncbi:MAG TPA: glycosyl hydrolase family 28 protein [Clostridia bacterium]|nr:glycosyl hydrolase family 28 protein [Clostridia bacterium]
MTETRVSTKNPDSQIAPAKDYSLTVNGEEVFVYSCDVANYAVLSGQGSMEVEITSVNPFKTVKVRPLISKIAPMVKGNKVSFTIGGPQKLSIEFDGDILNPLFILINPVEKTKPNKGDDKVRYFESGKVYDIGQMELHEGDTVYIAEGAVVYGSFCAYRANNLTIKGRGILNGSKWHRQGSAQRQQMIKLVECKNVTIEGITIVDGPNWHVVPIACGDVAIRDLNIITFVMTGDGIDVVGSENVSINNCFVRSNDDCVAIKAVDYQHESGHKNVKDVRISDSVFWNAEFGNALEIGYETRCDEISNIVFENCDVIRSEFEGYESGGTFTIHNGDRAHISNVRYDNIRVEDSREKLIDIKILFSQYSRDEERGQVSNITFNNIQVVDGPFPVSIVRGYDADHMIRDITIKDMTVHGERIRSANQCRMVVELSKNVDFE